MELQNPKVNERPRIDIFQDRTEAGRLLAMELGPLISRPAVVAAIPRGGVAVALPIATALELPLTVVYARKLTSPLAPELAFGAIDEDGEMLVEEGIVRLLELRPQDVEEAKTKTAAEIRRRMAHYAVPPLAHYLPACEVVLVDDGLATGLTMRAALAYARRHGARTIVVAAPCASATAAQRSRRDANHFVSLIVDETFAAVGEYYIDFPQISDEDVLGMLAAAQRKD
jgi:putative phosphoribosyl transferase